MLRFKVCISHKTVTNWWASAVWFSGWTHVWNGKFSSSNSQNALFCFFFSSVGKTPRDQHLFRKSFMNRPVGPVLNSYLGRDCVSAALTLTRASEPVQMGPDVLQLPHSRIICSDILLKHFLVISGSNPRWTKTVSMFIQIFSDIKAQT